MTDNNLKKKRPKWVWAIVIFFFFSASWTLLSFYLITTGAIPLNASQEVYFSSMSSLDYSITILIGIANLIGAVSLFLLRRFAFYLFAASLGASIFLGAWHMSTKGWVAAVGGSGIGIFIGWTLMTMVCIYTWRLTKRGILT